jgi:hypothetical protein
VALSPETVVQMAVGNLGQTETVSSISSPQTKAEKLGALWYDYERKRILAKHNWSWATKRKALTDATATELKSGWSYAYTLPSSVLRVIAIDLGFRNSEDPAGFDPVNPTLPGASWTIEEDSAGTGRVLLCDIQSTVIVCIEDVITLDQWDRDAVEALAWALSFRLAMPLTGKTDFATLSKQMAEETLNRAIADDVNEGRHDTQRQSEIIASRAW